MKTRDSFVSNSSSCSFCLGKAHLTDAQVEEAKQIIREMNDETCEGYIHEGKHSFFGSMSYHMPLREKLVAIGIDDEYIEEAM